MDWDAAFAVADDAAMRASISALQASSGGPQWTAPSSYAPAPLPSTHPTRTPPPPTTTGKDALPTAPLTTTAEFLEWFDTATRYAQHTHDQAHHAYARHLHARVAATRALMHTLRESTRQLASMTQALEQAQAPAASIASSSSGELERLEKAYRGVTLRLADYDALRPLDMLVRAPGDACDDVRFLPALQRAEQAARRLARVPVEGRDGELYAVRFAQARARALALIRMHLSSAFRRMANQGSDGEMQRGFRRAAGRLRPLVHALQQRAYAEDPEAEEDLVESHDARAALSSVEQAYFAARRAPLRQLAAQRMSQLAHEHAGDAPADVVRDWCAYMMNVCMDERRAYAEYFGSAQSSRQILDAYIEDVVGVLMEHVRPLVLAQKSLEVVAELALALLTFQRPLEEEEQEQEGGGEGDVALVPFYATVDRCVADAQQRLVFRAQAFVEQSIAHYRIAAQDSQCLARWVAACYALQVTDSPMLQQLLSDKDGNGDADADADADKTDHVQALRWEYPPVASCRWLVALIDGCLDPVVQRGIEDDARAACQKNLLAHAARAVRDAPPPEHLLSALQTPFNPESLAHLFVTYCLARINDHHP
ncbi:Golgi transport complex subunit 3 [Coemansia sp. RSA 2607]|nr:Golgi transport complex subunit 3 [Coemansia sp. RSA 2607]